MLSIRVLLISVVLIGQFAIASAAELSEEDRFKQAIELFQQKDYDESGRLLSELTQQEPGKALYWFNLGNAHYMKQDYRRALDAYGRVVALKSPLASAAELYSAKAHRQLGETAQAAELLRKLEGEKLTPNMKAEVRAELASLSGGTTPIEQALGAYRNQDYKRTIEAASQALQQQPTAEAYLLRGIAEMRLGDTPRAQSDFAEAQSRASDPELRKNAQDLLDQLREGVPSVAVGRRYWLTGDLAGGYNNNVYADALTVPHTGKPIIDGFLSLGGAPYLTHNFATRLGYSTTWEETLGLSALRFMAHYWYVQAEYRTDGWSFLAQPSYQYLTLGSNPFLKKTGGKARIQKSVGPHDLGFSWEVTSNAHGAAQFDYLSGSTQIRKLYWGYTATSVYFNLAYMDSVQHSSDLLLTKGVLPTGYIARGPAFSVSYYPTTLWELSLNTRYFIKSYLNQAYTSGVASDRNDKLLDSTGTVTYRLTGSFRLYASLEVVRNWSNLDINSVADKSYDQLISLGGISWDILP